MTKYTSAQERPTASLLRPVTALATVPVGTRLDLREAAPTFWQRLAFGTKPMRKQRSREVLFFCEASSRSSA